MPKLKTQEEYIAECINKHGEEYDYSKCVYTGALKVVTVICKKHGEFYPFAHAHAKGSRCKKCLSEEMNKTTEQFICEAKEIHGETYDYSLVVYKKAREKVTIVCKTHGEFRQTPTKHLSSKHGCPACGGSSNEHARATFIEKANQVHSFRYDYSKVDYKKGGEKVTIICREHGDFSQAPSTHLSGVGCPVCSDNSNTHARHMFVHRAKVVHGDKYDYSKAKYKNANTKVIIVCKEHGEFSQIPYSHLNGSGCPWCASYGFKSFNTAYFYLYEISDTILGFGVTNNLKTRDKQHRTSFKKKSVSAKLLRFYVGSGKQVLECERYLKNNFEIVNTNIPGFIEEAVSIQHKEDIIRYLEAHLTS